ncbi:MAG: hypothetical protein AAB737_02570 [Patescibacteria group bacterium]
MSECCGPIGGVRERMSPELMQEIRDRNQRKADRRGISLEEFLDANVTVSPLNRFGAWINLQLLKPWL